MEPLSIYSSFIIRFDFSGDKQSSWNLKHSMPIFTFLWSLKRCFCFTKMFCSIRRRPQNAHLCDDTIHHRKIKWNPPPMRQGTASFRHNLAKIFPTFFDVGYSIIEASSGHISSASRGWNAYKVTFATKCCKSDFILLQLFHSLLPASFWNISVNSASLFI